MAPSVTYDGDSVTIVGLDPAQAVEIYARTAAEVRPLVTCS